MNIVHRVNAPALIAGLSLFNLLGCKIFEKQSTSDNFGLLKIELKIDSERLGRMESELTDKNLVPIHVRINGDKQSAQLSYAGKSSIQFPKHSYNLVLSRSYEGISNWRLNTGRLDEHGLRSFLAFSIFQKAGADVPLIVPCVVYRNQKYMGLFSCTERIDQGYFERRGRAVSQVYKAHLANADFSSINAADPENAFKDVLVKGDYAYLKTLVKRLDSGYESISEIVDEASLLSYLVASLVLNNWDGIDNNIHIVVDSNGTSTFTGWDFDRIYEQNPYGEASMAIMWDKVEKSKLFSVFLSNEANRDALKVELNGFLEYVNNGSYSELVDSYALKIQESFIADRILSSKLKQQNFSEFQEEFKDAVLKWARDIVPFVEAKLE